MEPTKLLTAAEIFKHLDMAIFHLDYLCDMDDHTPVMPCALREGLERLRTALAEALLTFDDPDAAETEGDRA